MRIPLLCLALAACTAAHPAAQKLQLPSGPSAAAPRSWAQPRAVIIRHATVMTATGPALEDASLSFAEGRIVAVGKDVPDLAGAEAIDARGLFVTPGIIDAHSHLGVYPSPQSQGNSDGNEVTGPITPEVSAKDGFWPQDPGLRRAAAVPGAIRSSRRGTGGEIFSGCGARARRGAPSRCARAALDRGDPRQDRRLGRRR